MSVAQSSTEFVYQALAYTVAEVLWFKSLFACLHPTSDHWPPFAYSGDGKAAYSARPPILNHDLHHEVSVWSIDSMTTDSDSIRLVTLPPVEISSGATTPGPFISEFIKTQTLLVRDAVHELTRSNSVRLAGFVIDVLCTHMIDVADEFGVPSYLFSTSSAASLGFLLHLQFLHDYEGLNLDEFKDSDAELQVPSYANSVPDASAIMSWLDDQPPSSVVSFASGGIGSFGADQIKEIAYG
ncbi:UDP-glycosyltransferase 71E1 [Vitis vinifera]|uniref:UDP-glycosyltransferase 71E1 n=1 Tax=Vitis vinifera TaxID=29760 RepID=A0A438J0T2_VITVI|nr:UDP-glycosyltransferase 71E1 [Vitis vinifera]